MKELKGRPDEFGIKIKQYLEGLVRIPFGIYRKEPILSVINELNADFKKIQNTILNQYKLAYSFFLIFCL